MPSRARRASGGGVVVSVALVVEANRSLAELEVPPPSA